ncbi:hypothetical protein [Rhizobium phage RHph_X2_26]|nr:hypothetical protein [Rhizobium phage RHph_X2_26]
MVRKWFRAAFVALFAAVFSLGAFVVAPDMAEAGFRSSASRPSITRSVPRVAPKSYTAPKAVAPAKAAPKPAPVYKPAYKPVPSSVNKSTSSKSAPYGYGSKSTTVYHNSGGGFVDSLTGTITGIAIMDALDDDDDDAPQYAPQPVQQQPVQYVQSPAPQDGGGAFEWLAGLALVAAVGAGSYAVYRHAVG